MSLKEQRGQIQTLVEAISSDTELEFVRQLIAQRLLLPKIESYARRLIFADNTDNIPQILVDSVIELSIYLLSLIHI